MYEIEEGDVNKFKKLITNSTYIQDIEEIYDSTSKGKYFFITTKSDYRKALIEVNNMIKYIYPDRVIIDSNTYNQRNNIPIIHTNIFTYAQVLMNFYESNPVPTQASQKRLKLQFNYKSISEKRNNTQEVPQLIQKNSETKSVTFNTNDNQLNYQQRLAEFGTPPNTPAPHNYSMERKFNGNNYALSPRGEDPIISFQARIQQPLTPPHKNNPPFTQPHSLGGRGRGAYARYGGVRG